MAEESDWQQELSVLSMRQQKEEAEASSLEEGVYVNHKQRAFSRISLWEGRASICLPVGYSIMAASVLRLKYPSEYRPQIIYTMEDNKTDFTFNWFPREMKESESMVAARQFKEILRRTNPALLFYDMQEKKIPVARDRQASLSWFDYKSYALDGQVYNILYVMPLDKGMLQGTMNCDFSQREDWKRAAMLVMQSIREGDEKSD